MATYEKGDKDEEVGQIQRKLAIPVTNVFDARTVAAVKAWQKANREKPDGMIGPDMLLALGLPHLVLLENGDLGALVRGLQQALGLEASGEFDDETEKALRRHQKKNRLKATGSADIDLLQQLGAIEASTAEDDEDDNDDDEDDGDDDEEDDDDDDGDDDEDEEHEHDSDGDTGQSDPRGSRTKERSRQPASARESLPAPQPRQTRDLPRDLPPAPRTGRAPGRQTTDIPARGPIGSWAYQLADIDAEEIAALDVDLVVIDYAADGSDETAFTLADTQRMKQRPNGGRKLVVSYMSIGEAEDYRFYWQKSWKGKGRGKKAAPAAEKPAWLDDVNPDWEGNYKVRYWDREWQSVIMGSPDAYLDRIIAAGFDGVYLDIIDAFEYWRDEKKERPSAAQDMIAFVSAIAEYARARRPNFWIIPQNGEALLEDDGYRAVISAQGKEDIFYGQDGDGRANKKDAIKDCLDSLAYARRDQIPVLAIEYLSDGKKIDKVAQQLSDAGCTAYFGPRDLDKIAGSNIA